MINFLTHFYPVSEIQMFFAPLQPPVWRKVIWILKLFSSARRSQQKEGRRVFFLQEGVGEI